MPQEIMIVALLAMGPVIGSGIGVWKRPTTTYIHNMLYFAAGRPSFFSCSASLASCCSNLSAESIPG
jgi:hypothetical protein